MEEPIRGVSWEPGGQTWRHNRMGEQFGHVSPRGPPRHCSTLLSGGSHLGTYKPKADRMNTLRCPYINLEWEMNIDCEIGQSSKKELNCLCIHRSHINILPNSSLRQALFNDIPVATSIQRTLGFYILLSAKYSRYGWSWDWVWDIQDEPGVPCGYTKLKKRAPQKRGGG